MGEILEKLRQVEPDFWRRNPNIILVMIRLVIWLNSSEIGTSLFYFMTYTDDGLDKNCYYLRRGWFLIIFNRVDYIGGRALFCKRHTVIRLNIQFRIASST